MQELSHANEVFEKILGTGLPRGEFEDCTFIACKFADDDLSGRLFTDCQFVDCNLSTAEVSQTGLRNVSFLNCRIEGVDFSKCLSLLFSVSFDSCCLDYSVFIKSKLKKTEFKDCVMREADFTEADLTGALFENCDLTNTLFSHTNLNQADFRTARNYSINLEMNTARKAKFSLSEAAGLLAQYDIVVE